MLHFQTRLYKSHISSDTYLTTVLTQFDKFMEVLQGITAVFKKMGQSEITQGHSFSACNKFCLLV